jgi:hypothetical protein
LPLLRQHQRTAAANAAAGGNISGRQQQQGPGQHSHHCKQAATENGNGNRGCKVRIELTLDTLPTPGIVNVGASGDVSAANVNRHVQRQLVKPALKIRLWCEN